MTDVTLISELITFVVSLAASTWITSYRLGRLESDVRHASDQIAEIKGMFELRLRADDAARPPGRRARRHQQHRR